MGHAVIVAVNQNCSSDTDHCRHAVMLVGCDNTNIRIKNSATNQPEIKIPVNRGTYDSFLANPTDAVFYRWVITLRHKYGSKIIFRTSNVVLIL